MTFTILGQPYSKANQRRAVLIGGKPRFIKSKKALDYEKSFRKQADFLGLTPIKGDVLVTIDIYYASRRPDLDESLILDLLQGYAYLNDRQVKAKRIYWHLDRLSPRATITVEEIP